MQLQDLASQSSRPGHAADRAALGGILAARAADPAALARQAVRANVHASVDHLRHGSEVLEDLAAGSGLRIVGAEYSLETGLVEFHDDEAAAH